MCFDFVYKFCPKTFLITRIIQRGILKLTQVFMQSTRYCGQILMKFEFYLLILEKILKKKISR